MVSKASAVAVGCSRAPATVILRTGFRQQNSWPVYSQPPPVRGMHCCIPASAVAPSAGVAGSGPIRMCTACWSWRNLCRARRSQNHHLGLKLSVSQLQPYKSRVTDGIVRDRNRSASARLHCCTHRGSAGRLSAHGGQSPRAGKSIGNPRERRASALTRPQAVTIGRGALDLPVAQPDSVARPLALPTLVTAAVLSPAHDLVYGVSSNEANTIAAGLVCAGIENETRSADSLAEFETQKSRIDLRGGEVVSRLGSELQPSDGQSGQRVRAQDTVGRIWFHQFRRNGCYSTPACPPAHSSTPRFF